MSIVGLVTRLRLMPYVVLLAAVAGNALAQEIWQEALTDGDEIGYAAPGTISQYANTKAMWELRAYKEESKKSPNGNEYRSKLRNASYKCEENKILVTEELYFSGSRGDGRLVGRVGVAIGATDDWLAVRPKSIEATMMKIACAERSRGFVLDWYRKIDKNVDKFFRTRGPSTNFTATL